MRSLARIACLLGVLAAFLNAQCVNSCFLMSLSGGSEQSEQIGGASAGHACCHPKPRSDREGHQRNSPCPQVDGYSVDTRSAITNDFQISQTLVPASDSILPTVRQ